jgi:hypothetical protein
MTLDSVTRPVLRYMSLEPDAVSLEAQIERIAVGIFIAQSLFVGMRSTDCHLKAIYEDMPQSERQHYIAQAKAAVCARVG